MTDDHAQSALSCYGNTILKTPNLDRIASGGVRFNQGFVTNSLCLPSRASYLTGLYSHAHGMTTNGEESGFVNEPFLDNATTYPNMLRKAGYYTGVVGKWHVNTPPDGYDHTAVLPGQGQYFDPQIIINGRMDRGSGHTDDVIGEQAIRFLQHRPTDKPFCLLYQFKAPHRGWEPAPRFANAFADVEIAPPETFLEDIHDRPRAVQLADMLIADMADYRRRGVTAEMPYEERARRNYEFFIKDYFRVLLGVDENVGKVLDLLDRQGLSENTVVVYTSDNGFFLGDHGMFDKRLIYEQSIKVPMLVRHPASIAPGQVNDVQMVLNVDVAPTFMDFAGLEPDPHMHGRSWRPVVQGAVPADWRKDFLYQYFEFPAAHCVRPHRGVRTDRWKLIRWEFPAAWELYDLHTDPQEQTNLTGRPEVAEVEDRLRSRLDALRREVGDGDLPGYVPGDPVELRHCKPVN
ncbi:MAG: sulfatase [Alphaproteobacteria bacterium]|nr:sulfatase [Alphaproteobacteria bacterium]